MKLPTNDAMLQRLLRLSTSHEEREEEEHVEWNELLDADNWHRLHYCLQIVYAIETQPRST